MATTPNGVRVEVIWDSDTAPWAMNVFHLNAITAFTVNQTNTDLIGTQVKNAFTGEFQGRLQGTNRLRSVRMKDLRTENTDFFEFSILEGGEDSTDQIPDNVSLCLQLRTSPGQSNGRLFQWGYGELSNAATGRPSVSAISDTVDFWDKVRTDISGATTAAAVMAVLSRRDNLVYPVQQVRRSPSSSALGWQTQRRRRDGLVLL